MNWREWPNGAEEYVDDTGHLISPEECPVCHTSLRPVEIYYISREDYYYPPQTVAYYTALCPKCRTQYKRHASAESVIISPEAEAITELEERVRTLEETLSRLIAWIRTQPKVQPKALQTQSRAQDSDNDTEEFTQRYRYLL